jgi:hypothetical protein
MAIELVFETHSLTEDNEAGRATGWLPGRLSAHGREQARQLGERRRGDGIAAVFSSDLARAAETAAIAFGQTRMLVLYDWRLRECDYGQRNGMPVAEVHRGQRGDLDLPYPGGKAGGRPSTGPAGSSATCRCAGAASGSWSSGTSPPGGASTTTSTASRSSSSLLRTSPGGKAGSTGSADHGPLLAALPRRAAVTRAAIRDLYVDG